MKHTTLVSFLLVVLLLSACSSNVTPDTEGTLEAQAGSWQQVGGVVGQVTDMGTSRDISLAGEGSNTTVAFTEPFTGAGETKIRVKRWNGSDWTNVGDPLRISDGTASHPSLALDDTGNPVVAWFDTSLDGNSATYIQRFDGTTWVPVGTGQVDVGLPSLALDSSGNPVIAWIAPSDTEEGPVVRVRRFNGTDWVNVGTGVLDSGSGDPRRVSYAPSLVLDSADKPVVSWTEITFPNSEVVTNTHVQRFNGSSWTTVGTELLNWSQGNLGFSASLALDNLDNPVVAYSARPADATKILVKRFDGVDWVNVGSGELGAGFHPSLVINSSGNPVVAWDDTFNVYIQEFIGSSWVNVGTGVFPIGRTPSLSFVNNNLSLAFQGLDVNTDTDVVFVYAFNDDSDTTPPTITPNVAGTLGTNDWYTSNVDLSWTVADAESPVTSSTGCDPSSVSADTAGVTFTCEATSAGGTATRSVTVKRDATPPTVALKNVTNGGSYILGSVPSAACETTDALSGVATNAALAVTGGNPDGTGTFTATCSGGKDNAGNTAPEVTATYTVTSTTDTTPPTITPTVSGTLGNNGWYKSNVSVSWSVSDGESPVSSSTGCEATSVTTDTASVTLTCTATSAGGSNTQSLTVKRDATAPLLAPAVSPATVPLKGSASVTPNASDALSGLASQSCAPLDTNSVGRKTVSCTATDNAGNTASAPASYQVIYNFAGFYFPVRNAPALNTVRAGWIVPFSFSLGGNYGKVITSTVSVPIDCTTLAPRGTATATLQGSSSLQSSEQARSSWAMSSDFETSSRASNFSLYVYLWKTQTSWKNSCRQFTMTLNDGTEHKANFRFR